MTYQPLKVLQKKILSLGGTVNSHSHIDRAYTVTPEDMSANVELELQQKWKVNACFWSSVIARF